MPNGETTLETLGLDIENERLVEKKRKPTLDELGIGFSESGALIDLERPESERRKMAEEIVPKERPTRAEREPETTEEEAAIARGEKGILSFLTQPIRLQAKRFKEDKPVIPVRRALEAILPEEIPEQIAIPPGPLRALGARTISPRAAAGVTRGVANLAEEFTTPTNLAILGATLGAGAGLQLSKSVLARFGMPVIEAAFAGLAAAHAPEAWQAFKEAKGTSEKAEKFTEFLGSVGIALGAGLGAAKGTRKGVKGIRERGKIREAKERLRQRRAAEAAPEIARRAKEIGKLPRRELPPPTGKPLTGEFEVTPVGEIRRRPPRQEIEAERARRRIVTKEPVGKRKEISPEREITKPTKEKRREPTAKEFERAIGIFEKEIGKARPERRRIEDLKKGDTVKIAGRKGTFTVENPNFKGNVQLRGAKGQKFAIRPERLELPPRPSDITAAQQKTVKEAMEREGVHPTIAEELTDPRMSKRPFGVDQDRFVTTRQDRIDRAVDPPEKIKPQVDKVARAAKDFRDKQAAFEKARDEIKRDIEAIGGKIIIDTDTGAFRIQIAEGRPKMSAKDKATLDKLRKEAAEAGAFSLKTVGRGFEIAAAPLKISEAKSLPKADFATRAEELIRRSESAKKAEREFKKTKNDARETLIDNYLAIRAAGETPKAFKGVAADGTPVEVLSRRARSLADPDIVTPTRDFPREIAEAKARKKAVGEKKITIGKAKKPEVAEARRAETIVETRSSFLDVRRNFTPTENKKFNDVLRRAESKATKLNTGLDPDDFRDFVEIGWWVSKGLKRNLGEGTKITFDLFRNKFREDLGDDALFRALEPHLKDIYKHAIGLPPDFKSGDEIKADPVSPGNIIESKENPVTNIKTSEPGIQAKGVLGFARETAKKSGELGADYYLPWLDRVAKQSPTGKRASDGFRQAIDETRNLMARFDNQITRLKQRLRFKPNETRNLDHVIMSVDNPDAGYINLIRYIKDRDRMPGAQLTQNERAIIDLYRKIQDQVEADRVALGFVKDIDPYGLTKRKVPITLLPNVRQALFVDRSGPLFDAIVNNLLKENPKFKTAEQIISRLEQRKLGDFDNFPTHVKIKGKLTPIAASDALSALDALNFETARVTAFMKLFKGKPGKKAQLELELTEGEPSKRVIREIDPRKTIKALKDKFRKEGGKIDDFEQMVNAYWGLTDKRSYFSRNLSDSRNILVRSLNGFAIPVAKAGALSLSGPIQLAQPILTISNVGTRNYIRGVMNLARKGSLAELEALGALNRAVMDFRIRKGRIIEDLGRIASGGITRVFGFQPIVALNDAVASSAYRAWARRIMNNIRQDKKLSTKEELSLRALDLTDAQIELIRQGKLAEPQPGKAPETVGEKLFATIVGRGRKSEQFTGLSKAEQSRFQNAPLANVIAPFQGFTIGMMNRLRREAAVTKKAYESGRSRDIALAAERWAKLLGTATVAGDFTIAIRHILRGHSFEEAFIRPAEDLTKRFVNDMAESSLFGPFQRVSMAYEFANGNFPEFVTNFFFLTNITNELFDSHFWKLEGGRGIYADKTLPERMYTFLEKRIPAIGAVPDAARRLASLYGLANIKDLEIDEARRTIFKWRDDKGFEIGSGETRGFVESRRAVKQALDMLKRDKSPAEIQLKLGEALGFKKEEMLAEGREEDDRFERNAVNRIKSALRARRLLKSDGNKLLTAPEILELRRDIGDKNTDLLIWHDKMIEHLAESLTLGRKSRRRRRGRKKKSRLEILKEAEK